MNWENVDVGLVGCLAAADFGAAAVEKDKRSCRKLLEKQKKKKKHDSNATKNEREEKEKKHKLNEVIQST